MLGVILLSGAMLIYMASMQWHWPVSEEYIQKIYSQCGHVTRCRPISLKRSSSLTYPLYITQCHYTECHYAEHHYA